MNEDEITAAVAEYQRTREQYAEFGDALTGVLTGLAGDAGIETESITARAKQPERLAEKLRSKDAYAGLEDITDLCGVRVVTRYHADVARVCEVVEREFRTLEIVEHGSDEIRSFGYASNHLIVKLDDTRRGPLGEWRRFSGLVAEIQVRSILQHAWASISHGLDYKTGAEIPATVRRQLFRVAALLETGDELFDSFRASVEQVKSDYEATAKQDAWRDLSLDYDSLTAAWTRLPIAEIVEAAERHGWDRSALPETAPPGDLADRRLGRLITAASELGIRTLGKLADEIDEMTRDGQRIERIAELATANGRRPSATAPDVMVALLLSRDPRGRAAERLHEEGQASDTPLMRAVAQISREG